MKRAGAYSIEVSWFLSYAHADAGRARWLHRQLEGFRIDNDLVGRQTAMGPVPKRLRPIFRDREDFSGGNSLTDATVAALDQSAALIVLCSPVAATRPAVNEEVRLFRSRHSGRPVIPVIVDGTYPENFPPALRFDVTSNGAVTDSPITVLGPDLRETGDGKSLGIAKIVAGLIGLAPDDIFRRAERARRRSVRIRNGIIGILALLVVVVAGVSTYLFREELKRNEALLEATLKTATEIVNTAVGQAEKYNVPRAATLEMLTRAEALFDNMARLGRPTPELQRRKAWMLIQFARNYEILGDTTKQGQRAEEANRIMVALAGERRNDVAAQHDLAAAHDERGKVFHTQGNLPAALESYRASRDILESLVRADPGNAIAQHDLATSNLRFGTLLMAQGNLPEALESFMASLAILQRLSKVSPSNATVQLQLAVTSERIGSVLMAQGNLSAALEAYQISRALVEDLASSDPGNAGMQRNLGASQRKIGEVLVKLGNLRAALEAYRASLVISERLAKSDPSNAIWQRDFSGSHASVGIVLQAEGSLPAALESYRAALAISERLVKSDPGNTVWQYELCVLHRRIGDVLRDQSNLQAALNSYRASEIIAERLAQVDTSPLRDVALSLQRLGFMAVRQGDRDRARTAYERGREIMRRLVGLSPNDGDFRRDLAWFDARLAELKQ